MAGAGRMDRFRTWASCLGLAALCIAAIAPAPAVGQATKPSFREAPTGTGGTRLTPMCRVRGLVGGGVINMVSPMAEANRRREQLRGVATRLVTIAPVATELRLVFTAGNGTAGGVAAGLDAKLAATEAAFQAGGLVVMGRESGPVQPGQGANPVAGRMEVLLRLGGDVDPLAAMAMLPPDLVAALLTVRYEFPAPAVVIDPIRPELEDAARADAMARVAARGEGAALGERTGLRFSDQNRRFPDPRSGHRTIEVSAVATYVVSRPPGFGLPK